DLTAWPIAPAHRLSRNRRGGWYLFSRRRRLVRLGDRRSTCWRGGHRRGGARPEHSTYPSRLECRARFLTLFAQRTGAAMANAGGFGRGRRRPIRRRIIIIGRGSGRLLHLRIGQVRHAHRGRLCVLSQLQAEIPDPLVDDLPELLTPLGPRYPAIGGLFLIF